MFSCISYLVAIIQENLLQRKKLINAKEGAAYESEGMLPQSL